MLSRRQLLHRAAAAAVVASTGPSRRLFASASQPRTPVNFPVPTNACDCHTHVFGDPRRFPFAASRTYTPEPASIDELQALHRALGTTRVVVVQPSVYGTDNTCTLDAVRALGQTARGIAVIDKGVTDRALDQMGQAGIVGIRLNLATAGQTDPDAARRAVRAAAERIAGRGWHLQIYTQLSVIEALADTLNGLSMPVVFDHFGGAQASLGARQPGFNVLTDLVRSGHVYVKLSAPYRSSNLAPAYRDVAALATTLIGSNPERMLWGSDWPHPNPPQAARTADGLTPFYRVDDGLLFNQFATWEASRERRQLILVDNPQRLYRF